MRNFSMKKFGTPIGAGPGVASEKLGFAGVGMPLGWKAGAGVSSPRGPPAGSTSVPSIGDAVSTRG